MEKLDVCDIFVYREIVTDYIGFENSNDWAPYCIDTFNANWNIMYQLKDIQPLFIFPISIYWFCSTLNKEELMSHQ